MKTYLYSAFIAFGASMGAVAGTPTQDPDDDSTQQPTYTLNDVAQHAAEEDCWMAIEDEVYDVTDYIPHHPTPPLVLVPWCGTDATEGMRTKGYGEDHSPEAWEMLSDYWIGTLKDD